jgi:uncharacterized protein (TIGR02118 family)
MLRLRAVCPPIKKLVKFHWNVRLSSLTAASISPMVSYFVRYRGSAADPAGFAAYYQDNHSGILKRFPGIQSLVLHMPVRVIDPFPVRPAGSMLLAQMVFDSPAALDAALQSDARKEARDDFHHFPTFEGEVSHEALIGKVIF